MKNVVLLGDVCEVIAGQSPPSSTYNKTGLGLPFFQGKSDFGIRSPKVRTWCSKPIKIAEKGDILISVRAPVGPTNLCDERCCIGRGLSAIRTGNKINSAYLQYFLKVNEHLLIKMSRGSTFKAITQKDIKNLQISLPILKEQMKSVEMLDQANSLREKRKLSLSKMDDYVRSVFIEMFGDPVTNSRNWDIKKLEELTIKIGSGSTPKGGKESYQNQGISLIRSLNVHDNRFVYRNLAHISEEQSERLSNVVVEGKDILLNITGASVCRCTIVPTDVLPARVNQHVAIIRPNKSINNTFLMHLLISESFKKRMLEIASGGGATREALTKTQLQGLVIICPPLALQNEFYEIIQKVEHIKQTMIAQSQNLGMQFGALLQKSFKTD